MRLALVVPILFLSALPLVNAGDIEINVTEWGKTISYYDDYYVVNVNGSVSFTNPDNETLYDLVIPLALSPLRVTERSDTGLLRSDEIRIYEFEPGTTTIDYQIIGITLEDPFFPGRSILETHLMRQLGVTPGPDGRLRYRLFSKSVGTLMKAIPEDPQSPDGPRLISIVMKNPTAFTFEIDFIKVIKTQGLDPNINSTNYLDSWEFPSSELFGGRFNEDKIDPHSEYVIDFIDQHSAEGQIYWLNTNYYLPNVSIFSNDSVTHYTQDDLEQPFINETNITEREPPNVTLMELPLFLRKVVSDTHLFPGDRVKVNLALYNFEPSVREAVITDPVPLGFEILSVNQTGPVLNWTAKVGPDSVHRIEYMLEYVDEDSIGLDYFKAAEADVGNRTFYSRVIPFVRKFIPEKVLFVQKKLKYLPEEEVEVTLEIQNMGEATIKNIVLKEFLKSKDTFRQITKKPDNKGSWKIDSIKSGETWSVTYVTNENENLNLFPEIYGVDSSYVLKSLLLESIVHSRFRFSNGHSIELIGIALIIMVPLLYLYLSSRYPSKTKLKLWEIDKKIQSLKRVVFSDNQKKIDKLKREVHQKYEPPKEYDRTYTPEPKIAVNKKDHMQDLKDNEERLKDLEKNTDINR